MRARYCNGFGVLETVHVDVVLGWWLLDMRVGLAFVLLGNRQLFGALRARLRRRGADMSSPCSTTAFVAMHLLQ
jgi:hypothetical protein